MGTVGIISDSRIADENTILPQRVCEVFDGVDFIIHAGNICHQRVLDDLASIAPVEAVAGDLDDPTMFTPRLPRFKKINFEGFNIGISNEPPSVEVIKTQKINILVHGSTCIPKIEESQELRLSLNPGTPFGSLNPKQSNGTVILLKHKNNLLFSYIVKL